MADSSPLADLLDKAGNVFSLAGELGQAFYAGHQERHGRLNAFDWNRYAPTFNEFYARLLELRDAMQNPPDGFASVAKPLLDAARVAKGIRDTMQRPDGHTWATCLEFFPDLNSVCEDGWRAVKGVMAAQRLDDPFAFVDEPAFSLLDRFPATPAGHVAFLEHVRDEIHFAADAKRTQLARGYSNDTLASMIRGVKWAEASQRIALLAGLPADAVTQVTSALRRELSVGTVEQLDELLTPAIRKLRDAWEESLVRDGTVVEEVHPEVIQLQRWLAVDGIKGHWHHNIASAEFWNLEIDAQHRNIAFLVRQLMGGDPNEDAIRNYLFRAHGILPSDQVDLARLEQLLRQDAERARGTGQAARAAATDATSMRPEARGMAEPSEPLAKPLSATPADSDHESSPDSPTGFLGGVALADALAVHSTQRDAFFQRLMRQRTSLGDDCWHEVRDPRPNSPRFLYRVDSPKLRDLAVGYKKPKPT